MPNRLIGKKIVILVEDGYDAQHISSPSEFFKQEGAELKIVGSGRSSEYRSNSGEKLTVDMDADEVHVSDFDVFVIPGGQAPENMRLWDSSIKLIADADEKGKIIGSIGHGAQALISAGAVKDRMITCNPGIVIDVKNAGGYYVNETVVRDGNVISSRTGDDLPDFLESLVDSLTSAATYQKNMFAGA